MNERQLWSVQLWLGEYLIEEHIAPAALAEQYAQVISLRIHGLPGRHLRCQRITDTTAQSRPARDEIASPSWAGRSKPNP
ncbi:hypothetical protein ACXJJ3_19125 [Kribbella sp. WER1]